MTTQGVKAFSGFAIKDAAKGEVEAIFATLGVTDRDEDIIRKGAIPDGAKVVISSYGHDAVYGARPAGKGVIVINGNKAGVRGKIFLNTTDGRDTFEVLKEMGEDQEWSFGFRVLEWENPTEAERKSGARRALTKLDAFEVSPVMVAAGVGTRTTSVKEHTPNAQADGAGEEVDPALLSIATAAVKSHLAEQATADAEAKRLREEAETKAAEDAAAAEAKLAADTAVEVERLAATTKAAELAEAERVVKAAAADRETADRARADIARKAAEEFERLQRNMRRIA